MNAVVPDPAGLGSGILLACFLLVL
jgi:hypothetical protein